MFPSRRCAARSVLLCDRSLINFLFLHNSNVYSRYIPYTPLYKYTNINFAGISSTHPICLPTTTTEIHNKILAIRVADNDINIFFFSTSWGCAVVSLFNTIFCVRIRVVAIWAARLCDTSFGSSLFSIDQLCVDAVRGILFAHGAGISVHIRAAAGPLADGIRLDITGRGTDTVWNATALSWRKGAHHSVSIILMFYCTHI